MKKTFKVITFVIGVYAVAVIISFYNIHAGLIFGFVYTFALFLYLIRENFKDLKDTSFFAAVAKSNENPSLSQYVMSLVVGQDEAIKSIIKQIRVNAKKQEITGRTLPILGSFFLVGPSGVGKTETARAIASWFRYKYGHIFMQFDMGNFSDYHTASTLVGSPKGYIGSEEGGALTRPLMSRRRAVILFDEMEKAHPSLYRTFMALLDTGEIQEISTGARVRLNQSIIFFTSNLFQRTIREIDRKTTDEVEKELLIRDILTGNYSRALLMIDKYVLEEDLSHLQGKTPSFPPEFIARIDKVVIYKSLSKNALVQLVIRRIIELRIKNPDFDLAWELVDKYFHVAQKYGVRVFIKKIDEELL